MRSTLEIGLVFKIIKNIINDAVKQRKELKSNFFGFAFFYGDCPYNLLISKYNFLL